MRGRPDPTLGRRIPPPQGQGVETTAAVQRAPYDEVTETTPGEAALGAVSS